MKQAIDTVKDKQEEMAEDIAKIKEAVYNPDSGLYARLRELEKLEKNFFQNIMDDYYFCYFARSRGCF